MTTTMTMCSGRCELRSPDILPSQPVSQLNGKLLLAKDEVLDFIWKKSPMIFDLLFILRSLVGCPSVLYTSNFSNIAIKMTTLGITHWVVSFV